MGRHYACFTLIALLAWLTCPDASIIAYDCEDKNVDISTVSIRDVTNCPEPESEYSAIQVNVKVIQRNEVRMDSVKSCLVEVTRLITHCGMHSHSSTVEGGLSNYVHQLGTEECLNLHRYKSIKLFGQNIGKIVMNGTTTTSINILGSVDAAGNCKGTTYHETGRTWNDVIITASVKIVALDYLAKVKLDQNEISLKGGILCPYLFGYCFDTTLGESVWDLNQGSTCENGLSLLYRGPASRVTQSTNKKEYVVVEQGGKIFAVSLMKRTLLCGQEVWQTEHPRLLVVDGSQQEFVHPGMPILPQNTDLLSYVNSKFLYIEQAYKRDLDSFYIDTVYRRCIVHREVLRNRLLLAPFTPSAISQLVQNEQGYVGRVLGEVLYIMKCVPKVVQIRRTERCFHELPITVDNRSLFMAPITRIVQNHAEEVECNSITPPLYYIDSEWIGLTPYPTAKKAPRELTVESPPRLQFHPIQPVGQYGLYTQEEVSKVQRILTFGTERQAVQNIIARRIAGLDAGNQGYSTLSMFNAEDLKELSQSTIKQIYGYFSGLGTFFSGIIGLYMVFRLVKYGLGVLLNGFHLYKATGCGLMLIASLWNTLALWIVQRRQMKNETERRADIPNPVSHNEPKPTPSAGRYPVLPTQDTTSHWTEQRSVQMCQSPS